MGQLSAHACLRVYQSMIRAIERMSNAAAWLSAWLFFAIGVMITYEVVMRKGFNAPTVWVDDVSRYCQIWAVYLAAAYLLKHRDFILVAMLGDNLSKSWRLQLDRLTLLVVMIFSVIAIYQGTLVTADSIVQGRASSTMLGSPKWITEIAIPVGFALLLAQAFVEWGKLKAEAEQ